MSQPYCRRSKRQVILKISNKLGHTESMKITNDLVCTLCLKIQGTNTMSSKISAKFLEIMRNLKSDAVPRPAREETFSNSNPDVEARNENVSSPNQEEVIGEAHNKKKSKKKPKYKKSFSTPNKESSDFPEDTDRRSSTASSNVNTQATGNVINIVNSNNVRWGNEFVYYMGPVHGQHEKSKTAEQVNVDEDVEKTNLIELLLQSNDKAEHEYLDYIAKNLGKKWHLFFRKLGYKQGQIETVEIDMEKYGVAEARYKLLLDWIRNDDYGSLGRLSTVLWECEEKEIVRELADMYSKRT